MDLTLHRKLLLQSLAALDCELFTVPAAQMPTCFADEFPFDSEARVTMMYGVPYVLKEGAVLAAKFHMPPGGGRVGCSEGPTADPWPRVIWVSADPAHTPLLPMRTGLRPEIDVAGLTPGQVYYLNCFAPWAAQAVRYWGRRA